MIIAKEIAKKLLQINAIKLSPQKPFTWASGLRSPIYCDNRIVLSHPEVRRFVIDAFEEKSKTFSGFDIIAGVATAGIAHGALLAAQLDLPMIYVRSKPKGHGRQNQIEGELPIGAKVLVIEDLISTGGSVLQAVEVLRENGAEVCGVMAIFSYGFSQAQQAFTQANCPYLTLSEYDVLLEEATQSNYISSDERSNLQKWRIDPQGWSHQFESI
ncbi:MAG: orotate phosphoribosyltransferase [Saprospiraceae bacterium]|nr:MAG: orotate phosphoribosyltransferase [Saprospiraceae bacterium]